MVSATHISFNASDRSYFAIIKKEIHKIALEGGLPEQRVNEADIIVSELTSNLMKHASSGAEILAGMITERQDAFLEIISIDNGPGFKDAEKVMTDGFSTANTLGHGLGSIRRLSNMMDVYSQPGWGTIVLARIYKDHIQTLPAMSGCRGLVISKPGEQVSGDGYFYQKTGNGFKIMVADGLGHGPDANHAVNEGVKAFRACEESTAAAHLRYMHTAIKRTRGIVATITLYNKETKKWNTAGVGNITTKWIGGQQVKNHLSYNGIIGHNIPGTINDAQFSLQDYQQFIACSDGIRSRWDPFRFPLIGKHDPMILNAAIYKDFARRTDDTSVVACKLI